MGCLRESSTTQFEAANSRCVGGNLFDPDVANSICAYYKLDEPSGDVLDSSINGYNLSPLDPNYPPTSVGGLICKARMFYNNLCAVALSDLTPNSVGRGNCLSLSNGSTAWGWFKYTPDSPSQNETVILVQAANGNASWNLYFDTKGNNAADFWLIVNSSCSVTSSSLFLYTPDNLYGGPIPPTATCRVNYTTATSFDLTRWHFIAASANPLTGIMTLRVDNETYTYNTGATFTPPDASMYGHFFMLGDNNATPGTADLVMDEWGIVGRVLSSTDLDFLYNNGAGRTWRNGRIE